MAGGVSDRQQDESVFVFRSLEGFWPPGIPIHWIVGVLEEIGTGLVGEAVGLWGHADLVAGVLVARVN
jgi:hypothetical protein